jgi:hypothetical protein
MSNLRRRYELLLPLRYNDGQAVPEELIVESLLELEQQFGAVSSETQTIRGFWQHEGQAYRDELMRIFVDVPDDPLNRQFFVDFKERAKIRFRQINIRLTTLLVEEI